MRRRPKYQVFVSSTFADLRDERELVTWKLLKEDHIPAGMETFPASDDRGWETIMRAINDSDYYILIVGLRYGSVEPESGLSWTHREYRYAKERGIPVLAFLRDEGETPYAKVERDPQALEKLHLFRKEIQGERLYKLWRQGPDLCNAVGEALSQRIRRDEDDGTNRPGWFRGDAGLTSPDAVNEFARLSRENNELKTQIAALGHVGRAELSLSLPPSAPLLTMHPAQLWSSPVPIKISSSSSMTVPADQFKRWVDALYFTLWLPLEVVNTGPAAASDVLIELKIPRCQRILYQRPDPRLITDQPRPDIWERAFASQEDVFIQRETDLDGVYTIRQRIRRVLGNSSEMLVYFGAVLDDLRDWSERDEVEISYTIRDLTGVALDGSLKIPVTIHRGQELNAGTAQSFFEQQRSAVR